jgi:hypothetical protein
MAKTKPVFLPADTVDAYAIQAVARGEGGPNEQIRAITCIVNEIAGTYDMTFDEESARQSDFNEGRRQVGRAVVGIINQNLGHVTKAEAFLSKLPHRRKDNG